MVKENKKICVITGTRADYGLLRWVIDGLDKSNKLKLQLIVTGMHLSPEHGMTINEIKKDGYKVTKILEMLLSSDTPSGISKSIGLGIIGFADIFRSLKPDLIVVLGDRYEILSACIAAMTARIPIAHLHGGETTEGVIDEAIRHSITKMSHLHFVATNEYKKRVIQLGEDPEHIFQVGGLGIDNIKNLNLLDKKELERALNFKFAEKNLLVTFHPETLQKMKSGVQLDALLTALKTQSDSKIIFTMPNADTESRILASKIRNFCDKSPNTKFFTSLGQLKYLSCLKHVDAVIGNSSSGLIEMPSFKKATINIGERQKGRISAQSVIHCKADQISILGALKKIYSSKFQDSLLEIKNPYGEGGASKKIINILEKIDLKDLIKKKFFNLSVINY